MLFVWLIPLVCLETLIWRVSRSSRRMNVIAWRKKCNFVRSILNDEITRGVERSLAHRGFPCNLASWGMNTVLTEPPGSYSCAAGSIADRRNTLPLAFNVQLRDYSSLEARQKSKSKPRFRSARRTSAGVISNITRTKSSKSIVTIMRRGRRNMPRRSSTTLPRNAWQLVFRNAGGDAGY